MQTSAMVEAHHGSGNCGCAAKRRPKNERLPFLGAPVERLEEVGTNDSFAVVYFSRGTLPQKKSQRALLRDLVLASL